MQVQPEFTWIGTLVLMFAAIVPNAPWTTLLAGLLAGCALDVDGDVLMLVGDVRFLAQPRHAEGARAVLAIELEHGGLPGN
jgi:hypothetical protein